MDKAFINNMIVSAYEISQEYEKEKFVRTCSKNKKILCVDPHCKNPVLRYCHGDKKGAYFAHLANTDCDYYEFDKNDTKLFKELRIKLFHHFSCLGYKVKMEYKLLKRHYSPIFCVKENEFFVIEIGDSKTTKGYVEKILKEYSLRRIPVKWLVVGEQNLLLKENGVSFLKRFLLNESKYKDFILVDGNEIIQYRMYKKIYQLNCYNEIYLEKANLQDLCIVDGELTIKDYDSRFKLWQEQQNVEISQELVRKQTIKEEEKKQAIIRRPLEQKGLIQSTTYQTNQPLIMEKCPDYDSKVKFESGTYTCTKCGKIASNKEFYMIQKNTGICWECFYGPEKYEEIKKRRGW